MKVILFLFILGLTACSNEPDFNVRAGEKYLVGAGFYKDCIGIATDHTEVSVKLVNATCKNTTWNFIWVKKTDIPKKKGCD